MTQFMVYDISRRAAEQEELDGMNAGDDAHAPRATVRLIPTQQIPTADFNFT